MDFGFALPVSGSWATPSNVAEIATAADQRGYRTLWTFQRVLFPTAFELGASYRSVTDPIVTASYAAAVTSRVRLGLAVVNGPFYAPAVLAKQLSTLDVLSAGRLDAGIGLGWSPDEYAAAGVPMKARGRRFDEWLDCLHVLLTQDPVEFDGEFYTVPRSRLDPKPVQRPRPPLLIGGGSEAAYRRAATRGDGWVSASRATLDNVRSGVRAVREFAAEAGRDPATLRCVVRASTRLRAKPVENDRRAFEGNPSQIASDVELAREADVDEVFFDLNFDDEQVGTPDADPARAMDLAREVLDTFAQT